MLTRDREWKNKQTIIEIPTIHSYQIEMEIEKYEKHTNHISGRKLVKIEINNKL